MPDAGIMHAARLHAGVKEPLLSVVARALESPNDLVRKKIAEYLGIIDFERVAGIAAEVEIPDGGAEGVLMTQEGRFSGVGLGGLATLSVDGNSAASERIEHSIGYRISLDETLERWPRETLLEDVTRVIWRFRPQVVVAMFSPVTGSMELTMMPQGEGFCGASTTFTTWYRRSP